MVIVAYTKLRHLKMNSEFMHKKRGCSYENTPLTTRTVVCKRIVKILKWQVFRANLRIN